MSDRTEERIVDPKTGGEKGSKLARYDLIPAFVLEALAEHYGRGAKKYQDRNWEKGYRWGLSFAALMRHAWAWWRGEDLDEETGSSHMISVAWHALALAEFQRTAKGTDDRVKDAEPAPDALGPLPVWDGSTWPPPVGAEVEVRAWGPSPDEWIRTRVREIQGTATPFAIVNLPKPNGEFGTAPRGPYATRPVPSMFFDIAPKGR